MAKEGKKVAGKELKAIRLQAAGWLVRFHGRSMSCVQHVRYLNWLQRSPLHFEEMRNALKMRAVLSDARLWDGVRREHKVHARYHRIRNGLTCRVANRLMATSQVTRNIGASLRSEDPNSGTLLIHN